MTPSTPSRRSWPPRFSPRTGGAETYGFAHNLTRHAVYDEISAPRRGRLHRRVAEALDAASGGAPPPPRRARSPPSTTTVAASPGRNGAWPPPWWRPRHAEAVGSFAKAAGFYRMAGELLPASDERRPRLLGRLGVALAWALEFDDAVKVATEAGAAIHAAEGDEAAAAYLSEAAYACASAGGQTHAWALARQGLIHAGERRDVAWARMVAFDHQRREAEDPDYPGIPLETPSGSRRPASSGRPISTPCVPPPWRRFSPPAEAAESSNLVVLFHWRGEYRELFRRSRPRPNGPWRGGSSTGRPAASCSSPCASAPSGVWRRPVKPSSRRDPRRPGGSTELQRLQVRTPWPPPPTRARRSWRPSRSHPRLGRSPPSPLLSGPVRATWSAAPPASAGRSRHFAISASSPPGWSGPRPGQVASDHGLYAAEALWVTERLDHWTQSRQPCGRR